MEERTIYSNLIKLKGVSQVTWVCYSQVIPIENLYRMDSKRPSIFDFYNFLLENKVPCFLSLESSSSTKLLIILFAFYFSELSAKFNRNPEIKEIKNGIITTEMLNKLSANDLYPNKKDLFSISISNSISPQFDQSSTIPLKLNEYNEIELLLFAIKDLFSHKIKESGAIRLGRSFLRPRKVSKQSSKYEYQKGIKYDCIDLEPFFVNSNFYFKPVTRKANLANIYFNKLIKNGDKVLLSPYGTNGIFLNYIKLSINEENELLNLWSHRTEIPLSILDPQYNFEFYNNSKNYSNSRFCIISLPNLDVKLLYPCSLVFIPNEEKNSININLSTNQHNARILINSLLNNVTTKPFNYEIELEAQLKPRGNDDNLNKKEDTKSENVFESANITDIDRWFDSLSLTTKDAQNIPQQKSNLEDINNSSIFDTVSPLNPPPSLLSGNVGGTDPTPPTDNEIPVDSDMLGNNLGFGYQPDSLLNELCMDEFDNFGNFEITDTDFNFFDKVDSKNNSATSINPNNEHNSNLENNEEQKGLAIKNENILELDDKQGNLDSHVKNDFDVKNNDLNNKVNNLGENNFNSEINSNGIKGLITKERRNGKVLAILASSDPWISKNYEPVRSIVINRGFLCNGKYSTLSKELAENLKKTVPSPFPKLNYKPDYIPRYLLNQRKSGKSNSTITKTLEKRAYPGQYEEPPSKIFHSAEVQSISTGKIKLEEQEINQHNLIEGNSKESNYTTDSSTSESDSNSDSGSDSEDFKEITKSNSVTNLKDTVISPDFSLLWLRSVNEQKVQTNSVNIVEKELRIGNTNEIVYPYSIWKDIETVKLFMDQLRTYYFYPDDINTLDNINQHSLCYNPIIPDLVSSWKDVILTLNNLSNLFLTHESNVAQNSIKNEISLDGPLTLEDFSKFQSENQNYSINSNNVNGEEDSSLNPVLVIPGPKIQAYAIAEKPFELAISAASFWKDLSLKPIFGQKDISSIFIFPEESLGFEEISPFFENLFYIYKESNLGKLSMISREVLDKECYSFPVNFTSLMDTLEALVELSSKLGSKLASIPSEKFPENMMLFYLVPENLSSTDALWFSSIAFRALNSKIETIFSGKPQIHFQIIPTNSLTQYYMNQLSFDYYSKLSFNIYSRFCKTNSNNTNNIDNTPSLKLNSALVYSPPFYLSSSPPTQITFKMPHGDEPLFDFSSTLHLTYAWGADRDCLIAVWIDGTGQFLDYSLLPVDKEAFNDFSFLIDQIFQATKKFQARFFQYQPRLAITKLGIMEAAEIDTWKRLISNVPGSCVMCAGQPSGLRFYNTTENQKLPKNVDLKASSLIINEMRIPLARNVSSSAMGILSYDDLPALNLEVFLLFNTFQIASPPLHLIPSFRKVLKQLNDLRALDNALRPVLTSGFHPKHIRTSSYICDPLLPLPWRWVLSAYLHIQVIKK